MRYALKDYQEDAVGDVLRNLRDARDDWHHRRRTVAFSLTATTGAGKTVMAAAVIEALFGGNADFEFEPDPGAVVLWFTDDPSLNEQTRFRLMDAADRLAHSRLDVIENTFNQPKLEPGKVYFLNAQKLGKNSLLVRGAPEIAADNPQKALEMGPPDARAFTMWDTLANTIADKRLTLYLILDEAHRGMKPATKTARAEKATIVQRLVNGANGTPPVPIVWGISATVERFNEAMAKARNRTTYPAVVVDPARVQESGLLKDDIRLDFPAEAGQFDTVLLARATRKVKEITEAWRAYVEAEGLPANAVVPLLVVQVPNTPSKDLLLAAFTTIHESWPELDRHAMAHVFGEHGAIDLGGFTVPYVSPETVQDRTHIRVLFAKDAISTGWDCPRAEVLVSFRPARDETHITQLLGRMVRTPLARRVPGNDVLNSVECVLPHFDRSTAATVAKSLLGNREYDDDGTGGGEGRRVLLAPVDMEVNSAVPESVWQVFDSLPSQTVPRKVARAVKRLTALAQALSRDGLRLGALKDAYQVLFSRLDGLLAQYREQVSATSKGILEVAGESIVAHIGSEVAEGGPFVETADERSVEADFRAASRVFTPDIARKYADRIAIADGEDDGLFDAHVRVAALAQVGSVAEELDREADTLARKWFSEYRVAIKGLPDERRAVYDEIKGMSPQPQRIEILRPRVRTEETRDAEGRNLPTRPGHLMSDANGEFPIGSLKSSWEIKVLDTEMARPGFLAWYRNPPRPSEQAIAIAYQDGRGNWRRMCPDFLFFHGDGTNVRVSIVDPHGYHLGDALPKLRGLAAFAATQGGAFHRIESVVQITDGTLRVLDLMSESVRNAVAAAKDAEALYLGGAATGL